MLTNSAPGTILADSDGKMFMPQYAIEDEARYNATLLNEKGSKRAIVLYIDNEYSRAHEAPFDEVYKGAVVDRLRLPNWTAEQVKSAVMKLKSRDFDSLYVPDAAPFLAGLMTEAAKLRALDGKTVLSVFSFQMEDILQREKDREEGVFYSYPELADGQDAIAHFGRTATEMLARVAKEYHGESTCVCAALRTKYPFDRSRSTLGTACHEIRPGRQVRFPRRHTADEPALRRSQ
jgi:hypothetical protein